MTNNTKIEVLGDGFVELIDHSGSDLSIARAARVSHAHDSNVDNYEKLIYYLAKHSHMTPFEHNSMTFHIKCPLFIARQWMRHRIGWSYNEISRRYTSDELEFYVPSKHDLRKQSAHNKQAGDEKLTDDMFADFIIYAMNTHITDAVEEYYQFIDLGLSREQARMILPQSMFTRFYATTNLRALAHFYKLRAAEDAQTEIREYADAMGNIALPLFPVAWKAILDSISV